MELRDMILSHSSQMEKAADCMILFIGNVQNRHIYRERRYMSSCWSRDWIGAGRRKRSDCWEV